MPDRPAPAHPVPRTVTAASALLGAEALVLVGLALLYAVGLLRGGGQERGAAAVTALLLGLVALGVLGLALAVRRGRPWSRAPVIALQLTVGLPVVVYSAQAGVWGVALPTAAVAAGVVVLLVVPPSDAVLRRR